jgi:thiamine-monophosphate kinase
MLNTILENQLIARLAAGLPRSPLQINRLHEADAEILAIPHRNRSRLALTTDTVAEEIESGLYSDPWLIGWMSVMVNLSDLAAVGARPLGVLVAETLPPDATDEFLALLQQGIAEACTACGTFVLGGDTNSGPSLSMTACAVGLLENGRSMTRIGASPGDSVFVSGPLGGGSAFAFASLTGSTIPVYQPIARLLEGELLRGFASCCMDTSDGLLATLDQLMRLNNAGFLLDADWRSALTRPALDLARHLGVPEWIVIAGEHGEFELLFTIPEKEISEFLGRADSMSWHPFRIGRVTSDPRIFLPSAKGNIPIDSASVRNCAGIARRDIHAYFKALLEIASAEQSSTET